MKGLFVLMVALWLFCIPAFGEDLKGELKGFDYGAAENGFFNETGIEIDFGSLVYSAVSGGGLWDNVRRLVIQRLLGEGLSALKGIRLLIVIAVVSGFLKNLTESFADKATAEAGFWVCFMLCAGLGMGCFLPMIRLMEDFCGEICSFVEGCMPLLLTVITVGGSPAEALAFGGVMAGGAAIITKLLSTVASPLLSLCAAVCLVNFISEEKSLSTLFGLLKKCVEWSLKGGGVIFGLVCSLCKIGSAAQGGIIKKGAGALIEMVPVAGGAVKGSLDSGAALLSAIKSGTGIVFVVLIGIYALLPIVKVLVAGLAFKVAAGLTEPVCDKRISGLLDSLGDLTFLVLGIIFLVSYVFMFAVLMFAALSAG